MTTTVYTDGACLGNPGPGGWAWAVVDGGFASGAESQSTNQRMEVKAALEALGALPGPLVVRSDSQYVVKCFNDRWYEGWERRDWKNSKKEPVANQDLWRPLVGLFRARRDELTFTWVKGHASDPMNDLVDRLAVEAAQTQEPRSGDMLPTEVGGPDRVLARGAAKGGAAVEAAPDGHRVVVFGHRPPQLGGYGDNPIAGDVRRRLTEILAGLAVIHPDLVVLTGLGLGTEQIGAEAAAAAGVPYVAVLAFPNFDEMWPSTSKSVFQRLLAGATETMLLSDKRPASKSAAGIGIGARDRWLVGNADGALVVWDGKDRAVGELVTALERRIPDDVWIVAPTTT